MKLVNDNSPVFQEYEEQLEKVRGLLHSRREIDRQIETAQEEHRSRQRAARETGGAAVTPRELARYREKISELENKRDDLQIDIDRENQVLDHVKSQRSAKLVELNQFALVEIHKRRARALIEVAQCDAEEIAFRDAFIALDATAGRLRPMRSSLGLLTEKDSWVSRHLKELAEYYPQVRGLDFDQ